ncbi:hypothetical protein DFH09DRAFT_1075310 [Mycena vulgaris]|nr:hypothetical protein DFH09DRAFT_1075310 [Mycena vulgaris]
MPASFLDSEHPQASDSNSEASPFDVPAGTSQPEVTSENNRLERENALSNERLARLLQCHFARLPDEILLFVLHCSLPPSWVLKEGTSLPPFPQSIWSIDLRMKLCIIRVCKTWHRIGLELLYKTVRKRWLFSGLAGDTAAVVQSVSAKINPLDSLGELRKWAITRYHAIHSHFIATVIDS